METVELMISILLLVEVLIVATNQQLPVSLHDWFDHFEKGKLFSLLLAQEFAIELDKLEENALD
jgi:hypothetical protein